MTKKLSNIDINLLRRRFLGKHISVEGDSVYSKTGRDRFAGVCEFLGYNANFPSFGFQVTLNRMPIRNVDPKSIKLVDDEYSVHKERFK